MGDITDRIISWIERFVKVGDTIVQYDPGHAGLPWAAVHFILQVILLLLTTSNYCRLNSPYATLNYRQAGGAALIGVERATNLILKGRILEEFYINKSVMTDIKQTLGMELVETYANILKFLAKAKKHLQQGSAGSVRIPLLKNVPTTALGKFLSAVFNTGELAGLRTSIDNVGSRLSQIPALVESSRMTLTIKCISCLLIFVINT
jgi:hypothetical protein